MILLSGWPSGRFRRKPERVVTQPEPGLTGAPPSAGVALAGGAVAVGLVGAGVGELVVGAGAGLEVVGCGLGLADFVAVGLADADRLGVLE